jgi:hypothetical protein
VGERERDAICWQGFCDVIIEEDSTAIEQNKL